MNLKLITYTRTRNYGGILQAFGLYNHLESLGHDISFIDYVPERCNIENRRAFGECMTRQSRFWGRNALTKRAWQLIEYPKIRKTYEPFREFIDTRCSFTHRYNSCNELMADPPQADVFITGSDQVWNSGFTPGGKVDRPFYLPFADGRKISYASSFGTSTLAPENAGEVKALLSRYDALSVREQSGLEILKSLGLQGTVVCDPTMLCDPSIWGEMASIDTVHGHILLYQVRFDRDTFETALGIAKAKGRRLVIASMDHRARRFTHEGSLFCPAVEEWLALIRHADAVVTDSFHASVFAILFGRPFLVNYGARQSMSSRITELLRRTGLSDRGFSGEDIASALRRLESPIDWDAVNRSIAEYRVESRRWLSDALGR